MRIHKFQFIGRLKSSHESRFQKEVLGGVYDPREVDAPKALQKLATLAFRRQVNESEVEPFLAILNKAQNQLNMNKKEALAKIEELKKYVEELDKPTYSIGDRFLFKDGEEYILAGLDGRAVCLISLTDGNRWMKPVKVNCSCEITKEEFNIITGTDFPESFTKV